MIRTCILYKQDTTSERY